MRYEIVAPLALKGCKLSLDPFGRPAAIGVRWFSLLICGAWLSLVLACSSGTHNYELRGPVPARADSFDSLTDATLTQMRKLGLTLYDTTAAVKRMHQLHFGFLTAGPFLYADREQGCGLFCKRVDILLVRFALDQTGQEVLNISAFSYKRPALLADWRFVSASADIRRTADSLLVLSHGSPLPPRSN